MPSITYWNRLEPRPRSQSLGHSLSAKIRDPLWFLARQWQFGEFQGEDAASPAYIQYSMSFSNIERWHSDSETSFDVKSSAPLESQVQRESFTPDLSIAVELGQQLEEFLLTVIADSVEQTTVLNEIKNKYSIATVENSNVSSRDGETINFLRVFAGNTINGIDVLQDYTNSTPQLPDRIVLPESLKVKVLAAIEELKKWTEETYGVLLNETDSLVWKPERLEYGLDVTATAPTGERIKLNAHPGINGEFDWYDFDQLSVENNDDREEVENEISSVLPTFVRFTGMPNSRWWQFERGDINLSDVKVDPADTAKMALLDFALIHSNDWFMIPIAQPVGTLGRLNNLLVNDVFGDITSIDPAITEHNDPTKRWSLFTTSIVNDTATTDYFVLPPSSGSLDLQSEAIEEVRLLRDEMFNSAFGVEHITENGIGERWFGNERVDRKPDDYEKNLTESPLKYNLQSWLPENWIPFVPVREEDNNASVNFERAPIIQPDPDGNLRPVMPHGRILKPTNLVDSNTYSIREAEIPRTGIKVSRFIRRSRWLNGETHMWIARTVKPGAGEGSSGLRFDLAIPSDKTSDT